MIETCFIPFNTEVKPFLIPKQLNSPFGLNPPEICKIAAQEVQDFITKNQDKWQHNFGLNKKEAPFGKGKMFGVLVVRNKEDKLGYLCTFSGKLNDVPHPPEFVPSLFDISTNDYFINKGMTELTAIGNQIKALEATKSMLEIEVLKEERKRKSVLLQQQLFDSYIFLNKKGQSKSLCSIFEALSKTPPAGAGECAAPKLFQYAFKHKMKPLAIAEFWWGRSSKSGEKEHKQFYPACNDKCRPVLGYMLGI